MTVEQPGQDRFGEVEKTERKLMRLYRNEQPMLAAEDGALLEYLLTMTVTAAYQIRAKTLSVMQKRVI